MKKHLRSFIYSKTRYSWLFTLVVMLFLSGCGHQKSVETQDITGNYFDTYVSIRIYEREETEGAISFTQLRSNVLAQCENYEKIFSRTRTDSLLTALNTTKALVVSSEPTLDMGSYETISDSAHLYRLMEQGIRYGALTHGALDITVAPLVEAWNINQGVVSIPANATIAAALSKVSYEHVHLDGAKHSITLEDGATVDLGAIAKGYIADQLKDYLVSQGVTSAIIDLGGNILCIGEKSTGPFTVGIRRPFSTPDDVLITLSISDQSVVTSGTYERYFEDNGIIYHHIIDPKVGYPADSGLQSVTIISPASTDGDCLSTACMVLGLKDSLELINSLENVEAIFITTEGDIITSEHAEDYILARNVQ